MFTLLLVNTLKNVNRITPIDIIITNYINNTYTVQNSYIIAVET